METTKEKLMEEAAQHKAETKFAAEHCLARGERLFPAIPTIEQVADWSASNAIDSGKGLV